MSTPTPEPNEPNQPVPTQPVVDPSSADQETLIELGLAEPGPEPGPAPLAAPEPQPNESA